jgi:hypothetical protein
VIWGSPTKYNHGEKKYQSKKSMELICEFIKSLDLCRSDSVVNESIIPKWGFWLVEDKYSIQRKAKV